MRQKPLQYESLKAVLPYMEANKRFLCSICMRSVRKTDKLLPLKIEHLSFDSLETRVNDTTYGICRMKIRPDHHREELHQHDEDKYGFKSTPDGYPLTPGDVDLRSGGWADVFNGEGSEAQEQRLLVDVAHVESLLNGLDPSNLRFRDYQNLINLKRGQLQKFENRRQNLESPVKFYIKLTYEKRDEIIEYNGRKLFEAMKYLNSFLFGAGKQRIIVKKLTMPTNVLRLPAGLKFKVQSRKLSENIEKYQELIDESSYPLDLVTMKYSEKFENPLVQTSKKLMIRGRSMVKWTRIFEALKDHPYVVFRDQFAYLEQAMFADFINDWVERGRDIGTTCFMEVKNEGAAIWFLQRDEFRVIKRSDRSITIPMRNHQSVLVVSCETSDKTVITCPWIFEESDVIRNTCFLKVEVRKA